VGGMYGSIGEERVGEGSGGEEREGEGGNIALFVAFLLSLCRAVTGKINYVGEKDVIVWYDSYSPSLN